jgi:predicted O-methyltransferase YrrM
MSKLLFFIKFLKYLFVSKTKHGVHSPFVYDLVTNVINDKSHRQEYAKTRNLNASKINSKRLKLIYRIINRYKSENILEIGNSNHLNSTFLSNIQLKTNVFFCNVKTNEISEIKTQKNIQSESFDFAFYDIKKNDSLKLSDFMNHLKYFHNNSIVAINNIHQSKEMEEVWRKIITQKEVTISINLFFIGLVFFRKEQVKENFIVRF